MLEVRKEGPVTLYKMGRSIGSFVPYTAYAFLLDDLLIDTGPRHAGRELLAALEGIKVKKIIHTHYHEDHTGNSREVLKLTGAEMLIHPRAFPFIENPEIMQLRFYERLLWGRPDPFSGKAIPAEIRTDNFCLKVIHTPGHSPDHLCFYEPGQKWLFTGDIFCGTKFKYLRFDEDFHLTLASLNQLAELPVDTAFCSLLGTVNNGSAALAQKIANMKTLKSNVLKERELGHGARRIRSKLLGSEGRMYYATFGHYAKKNAVESIIKGNPSYSYIP